MVKFNRLGFGVMQDQYQDYIWHIVDRSGSQVFTCENEKECRDELRIYYT